MWSTKEVEKLTVTARKQVIYLAVSLRKVPSKMYPIPEVNPPIMMGIPRMRKRSDSVAVTRRVQ